MHLNWQTGEPCDCGFESHLESQPHLRIAGTIHEADKLDWLKSRGDKKLDTDEGQDLLTILERDYHSGKTDPLMPWLVREWKKDRLRTQAGTLQVRLGDPGGGWDTLRPDYLNHIADWYRDKDHPTRKGVDLMQHTMEEIASPNTGKVAEWGQDLASKMEDQKLKGGEIVHTTPDGYTVRKLTKPEELTAEGDAMGHCVGGYSNEVESGRSLIYSLRDPQNKPHSTIEIQPTRHHHDPVDIEAALQRNDVTRAFPDDLKQKIRDFHHTPEGDAAGGRFWPGGPDERIPHLHDQIIGPLKNRHPIPHSGEIVQIQGKQNQEPDPKYKAQLKDWFDTFHEDDKPKWGSDYDNGDYIEDVHDIQHHHLGGPSDYDEYGLKRNKPEIDWNRVVESTKPEPASYGNKWFQQENADKVYELAKAHKQVPDLHQAVQDHQQDIQNDWDKHYDSAWPQYDEKGNGLKEENFKNEDEYMEAVWEAQRKEEEYHAENHEPFQMLNHYYDLLRPHWNPEREAYMNDQWLMNNPPDPERPPQGNVGPREYFSKVIEDEPSYYRWAFSPLTGHVLLSHDDDHHPAEVRHHQELVEELQDPDATKGYVYRVQGGWRVLDDAHKGVEDGYIINAVIQALRRREKVEEGLAPPELLPAYAGIHYGRLAVLR